MKILHVINNLRGGGAQNLVVSLARYHSGRGHSVAIATVDWPSTDYERVTTDQLQADGVTVHSLGYKPCDRRPGWLQLASRLREEFGKGQPDLVHSHLEMSHTVTALARRRATVKPLHVATIHNAPEIWGMTLCKRLAMRAVFWNVLNRSTPRIYCSKAARLCEASWNGQWRVIPNGVAPGVVPEGLDAKRAAFRQQFKIPADALVAITVGTVREEKNHATAVRAIAAAGQKQCRPVHYVICGQEGNGAPALFEALKDTGISNRVHLLGLRKDAREILHYADCYLSASLREGLPLAVLEALFAGLPCVLSNIQPHRDVVADVAGCFLAEPAPGYLAEALASAAQCQTDPQQLRALRKPQLASHTIGQCADLSMQFYQELLEKKGNSKHERKPTRP
jgi:glycosyltransferase involved in cell wall biosynthesis